MARIGADAYAAALADHHKILRDALERHDGREVDTQGDAFFATFSSPSASIAAAAAIQRVLSAHDWPLSDQQVRVRIGIHTGEAAETPVGLVGVDVHRAARIASVAHGGQVVLSESAASIVRGALPPDAALRDLGSHRLKDLGRPETLFQLEADGLERHFPPLRSLDNPELPNNLPHHLSSFVGRHDELAEVKELVGTSRLVTLTGAGGSGKTRLALQAAADLLDGSGEGVFFVDLSTVGAPEDVPAAIHSALGLPAESGRPVLDALVDALEFQRVLIVLDNCEHVIDACAKVAELIEQRSRGVHLLATSREPLGIAGERVYRLRPLSLPPEDAATVADLQGSDATLLFQERVRDHDQSISLDDAAAPLVASLCRRLDGVPFALELAAARLGSMSLRTLCDRLDQRFRLLTGGSRTALARQRTLQAMVDWSYDLLVSHERAVLDRLSVFVGSFDLEAAEAVCRSVVADVFDVAEAIGSLVDKSLVVAERSSGDLRYQLLETIRQYATDKLVLEGAECVEEVHTLHAEHYLALCERAAPNLRGGPAQVGWLRQLNTEWENVCAAAAWFDARPGGEEGMLRLAAAVYLHLTNRPNADLLPFLRRALERAAGLDPSLRALGFNAASWNTGMLAAHSRTEMRVAADLSDVALELARGLDNPRLLAEVLSLRAIAGCTLGEADWRTYWEEAISVARSIGDPWLIGLALASNYADHRGSDALQRDLEALECYLTAEDVMGTQVLHQHLAADCLYLGDVARAARHCEEAHRLAEEAGSSDLDILASNLAVVSLLLGELETAERHARRALIGARRRARPKDAIFALWVLACCATERAHLETGALLTGAHDEQEARILATSPRGFLHWPRVEQERRDANRDRLRELLDGDAFERAYDAGRAMTLEAACDIALGQVAASSLTSTA